MGKVIAAGFLILLLWLFGGIGGGPSEQPKKAVPAAPVIPAPVELTEEQKAEQRASKQREDEENTRFYADVAKVRQLRTSMKNPRSFELEDAVRMDDGTLCIDYRATNSFNAALPGQAVITQDRIITSDNRERFVPIWNRRCAKKSGISVRHIRVVL